MSLAGTEQEVAMAKLLREAKGNRKDAPSTWDGLSATSRDNWIAQARHILTSQVIDNLIADELERIARQESGLAQTVGSDIDGRGRARLREIAKQFRKGKR